MITNKYSLPLPLQVWLANDEYDGVADAKYISATQILKPTRQTILSRRLPEITSDISDYLAASSGTAIHNDIEHSWESDKLKNTLTKLGYPESLVNNVEVNPETINKDKFQVFMEKRAIKEFNGWKIGGKFDFVINGQLHDIKTTSVYTYINDNHREDYILQGSIYKWLNPDLISSDSLIINYVFTDWSSTSAKGNPNYPQVRAASREYPLLSLEAIEEIISNKLKELDDNLDKDEPIECPESLLWFSDTVYKYYSDPTKVSGRATKNFTSLEEAHAYMLSQKKGKGIVIPVQGTPRRCQYCPAFEICSQRRKYYD